MVDTTRRGLFGGLAAAGLFGLARAALAEDDLRVDAPPAPPPSAGATVFRNVRVFDGRGDALSGPSDVLVRGGVIEKMGAGLPPIGDATEIAGGGRVLMPGLIDAHWHAFMAGTPQPVLLTGDIGYLNLLAARQAQATLLRGFTTIRDMGGPVFGLKRAIDEGAAVGPRIYPSGAMISQTSGHGDFRFPFELPRSPGGPLSWSEQEGISAIADSPDEVRLRAREQLRQGASQIKLMGGGGVSSQYNPIESVQFTEPEIRAGVEAAENWGTYVAIHAYTPPAIRQAIAAGVKCIDHGQLIDEATAKLLVDKGLWWSLQPLSYNPETFAAMSPVSQVKAREVFAGTDRAYRLARKLGAKTAWGSDILFNPVAAARQGAYLALMTRWYSPAEALRMATAANAELLAMSGFSNPYPGRLGVVEPGAHADLLLVEGNPLQNLELVADPERSFRVIMKAGTIYKNTLA
ncbi:amidohydrolase family protein [Caulobacter sp. 17J80-11]|uniref:metal-dependent hydrolase family protein n=1 Tax=Caulobacter sp. 17J80-11 TaxID=2763502 RepID=UPI001653D31D|nr:amidohydrolase family protein [Caulobacter sp. 17J80-11]MBC6983571.1 amidohydrolase family protein [Caulobacter sp. 17J80-11]